MSPAAYEGSYNVGIAGVVFVLVFLIPSGLLYFAEIFRAERLGSFRQYVEDWAGRHAVLSAFLLVALFALLGHFLLHQVVFSLQPGT